MIRWTYSIKFHRKKFWILSNLLMCGTSVSQHSAPYSIKHSKTTISGLTSKIRIWCYNTRWLTRSKNRNKSKFTKTTSSSCITHCRISSMAVVSIFKLKCNNNSSSGKNFLKHTYRPMLQLICQKLGSIAIVIHLFRSKDEINSRSCQPACQILLMNKKKIVKWSVVTTTMSSYMFSQIIPRHKIRKWPMIFAGFRPWETPHSKMVKCWERATRQETQCFKRQL